jgi:hypothetical protein
MFIPIGYYAGYMFSIMPERPATGVVEEEFFTFA